MHNVCASLHFRIKKRYDFVKLKLILYFFKIILPWMSCLYKVSHKNKLWIIWWRFWRVFFIGFVFFIVFVPNLNLLAVKLMFDNWPPRAKVYPYHLSFTHVLWKCDFWQLTKAFFWWENHYQGHVFPFFLEHRTV